MPPVSAAIVLHDPNDTESPQSVASRCQEKIVVQMHKCLDRRMKEFEKCKKNGLRGGKISFLYPGADDGIAVCARHEVIAEVVGVDT